MTNQEKLKAVIKQVQSRGWMEGWEIQEIHQPSPDRLKLSIMFKKKSSGLLHYMSLNDILFGTDFCEKFFALPSFDEHAKQFQCESCWYNCSSTACLDKMDIINEHKKAMLSMTESERIDFLYKHVEVKEYPQKYPNITTCCEGKCTYCPCHTTEPHACEHCCVLDLKTQPKEIKKIACHMWHSSGGKETEVFSKEEEKINELVDQVNANTKAISARAKDCKLNRG